MMVEEPWERYHFNTKIRRRCGMYAEEYKRWLEADLIDCDLKA